MNFINITEFDINQVHVAHRTLASGKTVINVRYGEMHKALSFVTPPAVTFYPRINGDGNYREGAQFGPASRDKAQYTLDLTCANIGEHENTAMFDFQDNIISAVDDAVLTTNVRARQSNTAAWAAQSEQGGGQDASDPLESHEDRQDNRHGGPQVREPILQEVLLGSGGQSQREGDQRKRPQW